MDKNNLFFSINYKYLDYNIDYQNIKNSDFKIEKYIFVGPNSSKDIISKLKKDYTVIEDVKIYPYDSINTIKHYINIFIEDIPNIESILLYYNSNYTNDIYKNIYNYYLTYTNLDILKFYNNTDNTTINSYLQKLKIISNLNYDKFKKVIDINKNNTIPLGYSYNKYNQDFLINCDIYNNLILDKRFDKKESIYNDNNLNESKTINHYINNKTNDIIELNLYNFKKVHEFISNNKYVKENIFKLDTELSKKDYIELFVKKYFYYFKDKKFNDIDKILKKDDSDYYKKLYNSYFNLSKFIHTDNNDFLEKYDITHYYKKIPYFFSKENIINIEKLYNEFELDYDTPFVSYKSNIDYVYKFRKDIYFDHNLMEKWINHEMYDMKIKKNKPLFLKGITFKVLYGNSNKMLYKTDAVVINRKITKEGNFYDLKIEQNNQIIKNIKLSEKHSLYSKINNYKHYEPIYIDINILMNGEITIFANYNVTENKINNIIKQFLNKISNYYFFNKKYIKIEFINDNDIFLDVANKYKLKDNIDLIKFNKVLKCFSPFFTILNKLYKPNDSVNIISQNIFGKIIKYNKNGTYNVELSNGKKKNIHPNNFLDSNSSFINLSYIKCNNHDNIKLIYNIINESKLMKMSNDEIIEKIQSEFLINKNDSSIYLENYNNEDYKYTNTSSNNIHLYIYELNQYSKNDFKYYPIKYYNINSYTDLKYINILIKSMFMLYTKLSDNEDILNELCSDKNIEIKKTEISNESDDLLLDDKFDNDFFDSDEEDDIEVNITSELQDNKEVLEEEGIISNQYSKLQLLYNYDPELFQWKSNQNFARLCQPKSRYPIVLTDSEKNKIDKKDNEKTSYFSIDYKSESNNCDLNPNSKINYERDIYKLDEEADIKGQNRYNDKKCNAIKYRDNWYVCPKIWCVNDRISLNIDELIKEKTEFDNEVCKEFKSNNKFWYIDSNKKKPSDEWRICLNCDNDISEHNLKCPICKKGVLTDTDVQNNNESLYIIPDSNKLYYYPGLMNNKKHPNKLYPPCCFTDGNKFKDYMDDKFKDLEQKKKENTNKEQNHYIKKYSNILNFNQIGSLPNIINNYLNNNKNTVGFSNIINNCYITKGFYNKNKNNIFFNVILNYINEEIKEDWKDQKYKKIYNEWINNGQKNLDILKLKEHRYLILSQNTNNLDNYINQKLKDLEIYKNKFKNINNEIENLQTDIKEIKNKLKKEKENKKKNEFKQNINNLKQNINELEKKHYDLFKNNVFTEININEEKWIDLYLFNFKKELINVLNEEIFNSLDYGHIKYIFEGFHISKKINSFQNYLEYILSDLNIQFEYFWNLFNRKIDLFYPFNIGVNIFIFEIKNGIESLLLPNFKYNNDFEKFIILFKNEDFIQSIYYKKLKDKNNKITEYNIFDKNKDKQLYDKIMKIYNDKKLINKPKWFHTISKDIKYYIEDKYGMIIGVVLKDTFYIPFSPIIIDKDIDTILFEEFYKKKIYNSEKPNFNGYIKLYNKYKNKFDFEIKYKLINENKKIKALITSKYQIIPLSESDNNNQFIEVDDNIFNFNKKNNKYKYNYIINEKEEIKTIIENINNSKNYNYKLIQKTNYFKVEINKQNYKEFIYLPFIEKKKINEKLRDCNNNIPKIKCNKDIINEYIKLYYLSNSKLHIKPLRFIIQNKIITHILLSNGYKIPIFPIDINSSYTNPNNKQDFFINYIHNTYYNILHYENNKNNLIDSNTITDINKYNWNKILYKKYLYHINNKLTEENIENIKNFISYKQYKKLYDLITDISNEIKDELNSEIKIDCDIDNILCHIKLDEEISDFIDKIVKELIQNKYVYNKLINKETLKYINNDKYIIIERNEYINKAINNLYKDSKNKYIQYPNLFNLVNINKIYI